MEFANVFRVPPSDEGFQSSRQRNQYKTQQSASPEEKLKTTFLELKEEAGKTSAFAKTAKTAKNCKILRKLQAGEEKAAKERKTEEKNMQIDKQIEQSPPLRHSQKKKKKNKAEERERERETHFNNDVCHHLDLTLREG